MRLPALSVSRAYMKITHVSLLLLEHDIPTGRYAGDGPPIGGRQELALLKVTTDQGIEGHCFVGSFTGGARTITEAILNLLRQELTGQDPLNREQLWQRVWRLTRLRQVPMLALGAMDVALWDICGKVAGLPIYKLLGAYRERAPAYASSLTLPDVEEYVQEALDCKERGFKGYKARPWGIPEKDLAVCQALRKAFGDDMTLMVDAMGSYDYVEALGMGRELEQMGFYRYDAPLPHADLYGYVKLARDLDIPIAGPETAEGGAGSGLEYITRRAVDVVRSDVALQGGITAVRKRAALSEAFGLKCELSQGGNSSMNLAALHLLLSIKNSDYCEVVVPESLHQFGLAEDIRVDREGYVQAPTKPGLGQEIDWVLINQHLMGTL